jgi:hypothetical protein
MQEISRPRQPGAYHGRLKDLKRALAPIVAELLVQSSAKPLDPADITKRVLPAARLAGWGEPEVAVVVAMLTTSEDKRGARVRRRRRRE